MTIDRETVIRFGEEAGLLEPGYHTPDTAIPDLERFAALVLEHGREPLTEMDCLIALENTAVNDMRFSLSQRVAIVRAVEAAHGIHA